MLAELSRRWPGVALLALAFGCGCAHTGASLNGPAQIAGHWRSERPEALPSTGSETNYLIRRFAFEGDHWTLEYGIYADEGLQTLLLSGRNEGRYRVAATPDQAGRAPAEFTFERRTLTARTARFAQALSAAGCGAGAWEVDRPQSVLERGCRAFRVFEKAACDREYDLVKLENGRLRLGARPADGSLCAPAKRPQDLGAPLVKDAGGPASITAQVTCNHATAPAATTADAQAKLTR